MQEDLQPDQIQPAPQQINSTLTPTPSWWNSTTTWMKKKYFNSTHLLELALNDQKSTKVWLFGMAFQNNQDARVVYGSVLWFTYREDLSFYKIDKQFTITSDVGWGCMVRVGQMMLAHCLRIDMGVELFDDPVEIAYVLREFVQEEGKFSVQRIAGKAFQLFGLKPGDWYSPSEIAHTLCDLQNQNKQSALKVMVFDNQFQLSKTLTFFDQNRSKNQRIKYNSSIIINAEQLIKINPGLIIILFRIGYKTPQKQLLDNVIRILKQQRNCIGILGGRPGKAHYIMGSTQKSFVYLDPHCVKQTNQIDSFFCSNMFSIPHQNIDPSMGLCFYIRNTAQLIHLYDRFDTQRKKLPFYSYSKCEVPLMAEKEQAESGTQIMHIPQ